MSNEQRAAEATGCRREPSRYDPRFVYCGEHDGLGNPEWDSCLWVPVAAALDAAEARGRAEVLARVEALAVIYADASEHSPYTATYTVAKALRALVADLSPDHTAATEED